LIFPVKRPLLYQAVWEHQNTKLSLGRSWTWLSRVGEEGNITNLPSKSWLTDKLKQYKLAFRSCYRHPNQASDMSRTHNTCVTCHELIAFRSGYRHPNQASSNELCQWVSHGTRANELWHTLKWTGLPRVEMLSNNTYIRLGVMSMRHGARANESWHTSEMNRASPRRNIEQ
jgi:hypothetical protein